MSRRSLYVHVPFCVVKCGYCDFVSYEVDDRGVLDVYLDHLERELALVAPTATPVSVFLGGGTPTFLDEDRLRRLFLALGRHIDLASCEEVTMEANPESATVAKGQIAREAGVNRVSVGAQSFHPDWLRYLDRAHTGEQTHAAVRALRDAGFDNLSLDLMFGLPGQTAEQWQADLDTAVALGPDHLSCYNLTFEPGTRLGKQHERGEVAANEQEADRAMFLNTRSTLAAAGFEAYEISNFAGRGGSCQHNDHYWLQGDYDAVGPGAAAHRQGVRTTNLKPLEAWARSIDRGIPPVAEAETLDRPQRLREALWLGIRRRDGVDLKAVYARLQLARDASVEATVEALVRDGLLHTSPAGVLTLTDTGLPLGDTVGEHLLCAAD